MSMRVFQITMRRFHYSKLNESDVGLWCFTHEGEYYGFCETEQQAISIASNFDPRKDAAIKIRF